jgi:hypothetical protein
VGPAEIRSLGRGLGKAAVNPKEAFSQALAVAEIRNGARTSPHTVTLAMFGRGFIVPETELRAAYVRYFEKLRVEIEKAMAVSNSNFDAAEILAFKLVRVAKRQKSGRYLLSRAGQLGESPASVLQSVMTVIAVALLGGDVREFVMPDMAGDQLDAIDELLESTGISGLAKPVGSAGPIVGTRTELRQDILSLLEASSLEALEAASQTLPLADLVTGRDNCKLVIGLTESVNSITKAAGSPDDAFGTRFTSKLDLDDEAVAFLAVMMASISHQQKQAIEEGLPLIGATARRTEAVRQALEYYPKPLRRFLGPEGEERLARTSKAVREKFGQASEAFAKRRPDLAELIATTIGGEP